MSMEAPEERSASAHERAQAREKIEKVRRDLITLLGRGNFAQGWERWVEDGYDEVFERMIVDDVAFGAGVLYGGSTKEVAMMLDKAVEAATHPAQQRVAMLTEELRARFLKRAIVGVSTVALAAGAGAVYMKKSHGERTLEPVTTAEKAFKEKELLALDPEATPDRLRRYAATLPEGTIESEVASIGFRDEELPPDPSYGLNKNWHVLATASGGEGGAGGVITFYKRMKNAPSKELWEDTALHEFAHLVDERTSSRMTLAERTVLRVDMLGRVQAPDRFMSPYVEAITNADPSLELEMKAIEYEAETFSAYLRKDPRLPAADASLMQAKIAKYAPNFDRDQAWADRQPIMAEMTFKELDAEFETLSSTMRDAHAEWLQEHQGVAGKTPDPKEQRQGRQQLVEFIQRSSSSTTEVAIGRTFLRYCMAREGLGQALQQANPLAALEAKRALLAAAKEVDAAMSVEDDTPLTNLEVLENIESIVEEHDLVLGNYRGVTLDKNELEALFPDMTETERSVVLTTFGWRLERDNYKISRFFGLPVPKTSTL